MSAKPKASNTAKANKRILEMATDRLTLVEQLAVAEAALRTELVELEPDSEAFRIRLKERSKQIATLLYTNRFSKGNEAGKAKVKEEVAGLPEHFRKLFPSHVLPEHLRPKSTPYTRKKSPSGSGSGSGLGRPEWIQQPEKRAAYAAANQGLKDAFGPDITKTAPFIGAVCDPIGFQQHRGECATDSLQQLLLFADQWKAKTQPLVYTMTLKLFNEYANRMMFHSRPANFMMLYEFFRILQMRFRLHYAMIGTVKYAVNDECIEPFPYRKYSRELTEEKGLTGALATRKRRLSANLGIGARNSIVRFPGTSKGEPIGSTGRKNMVEYFGQIWAFCGLREYISFSRVRHASASSYPHLFPNYSHVAFYLASAKIDPRKPISAKGLDMVGIKGHATAIYMCDGKWVYYDDNQGIMNIAPQLIDDILNEVDPFYIFWAYSPGSTRILFFKAPIFTEGEGNEEELLMRENDDDWSGRMLYQWTNDSWKEIEYSRIIDLASETRIYSFDNMVHIATLNKAIPGYPGTHFIDDQGSVIALATAATAATTVPFSPPAPVPEPVSVPAPAPVNSLAGTRKAFKNALENAKNKGKKRVNNTTRALQNRIKNLGLNRYKYVNNTEHALKNRILELASGSTRRLSRYR